jgi:signal transduction histidine kinase/DNA-binding NarL/FixJ family response regulator
MSIRKKLVISAALITLAVAAVVLAINIVLFSGFVDASTVARVDAATKVAVSKLEALKREAWALAAGIAANPDVYRAIADNDSGWLMTLARSLLVETGMDYCTVTDSEGRAIIGGPLKLNGVSAALRGGAVTAIDEGGARTLSVHADIPVTDESGAVAGVVSVGFRLDKPQFVDSVKEMMGCEVNIILNGERIATTVTDENGVRITGSEAEPYVVDAVMDGNSYSGRVDIQGRMAVTRYTPVYGGSDTPAAIISVAVYLEEEVKTVAAFVQGSSVAAGVMMAVSITSILIIVGHFTNPIRAMTAAASAMAIGDTGLDIQVNTNDETRTLADAFIRMIKNTRMQIRAVESIAAGDLSVTLTPRSDKDLMNHALEKLKAGLKEEHNRIKIMLDATPLTSRLWDKDLNLIECNEAALKLFGMSNKQEYIERYFELSPEYQPDGMSTKEKLHNLLRETFDKGLTSYEWVYRLPDGTLFPAECTMVRVPYGGGYAVAGYSRDLREQKKMMTEIEETSLKLEAALNDAKNANNAKTSFLAQMSHEIRTPLNAVVGLSELALDEGGLTEELADKFNKIQASGLTILRIVNDILDISKIESGRFELHPAKYDTPSLINDIVTLNIVRIGEKPIDFKLELDDGLPCLLIGDDLRVKQVFNNLLSNAFKYTEAGAVTWSVGFETEGENIWLVSSVEDTGIGIKADDLPRLFSDYNRVDVTSNRMLEGTGLGLAITKRLVEMMDGTVNVESEYGGGSKFTVRLRQGFVSDTPIGRTVAENLQKLRYSVAKRNARANRVDLSYARVLIVDDIPTNLDVVKGMLKPYKLKIDCASSGFEAIEKIRAGFPRYDAVFMDHMMPEMDGIEATRIIRRELDTAYARNLPVIALTANAVVGNEKMFLENGFQGFISKPIDMGKLDSVLRRLVRDKQREKEAGDTAAAFSKLDKAKALAAFNGDESVLTDVLRSYASGTKSVLANMAKFLLLKDMKNYAIAVHGLKGSSFGIMAYETGLLAEQQELAANASDWEAVKAGHVVLVEKVEELINDINTALPAYGGEKDKPVAGSPNPALLAELRAACRAYDMETVDAVMDKLDSVRYEHGQELINWLKKKVTEMAFEVIANEESYTDNFNNIGL